MANLAATLVAKVPDRTYQEHWVDVTGPSSYTTGGETITTAIKNILVGPHKSLTDIAGVDVIDSAGYGVKIDKAGSKFLFYASGGTQVSSTTDLSAVTVRIAVKRLPVNKGF
jgi:hypothetical protein